MSTNIAQKKQNAENLKAQIQNLEEDVAEDFRKKSFAEKWYFTFLRMKNIQYAPSVFSVAFSSCVFLGIFPQWHFALSLFLGFAVSAIYESLKHFFLHRGFEAYFHASINTESHTPLLLAVGYLLTAGSVAFALLGAYRGFEEAEKFSFEKASQIAIEENSQKLSSIEGKIADAQQRADKFYEQNTVAVGGGKRVLRISATKSYNKLTDQVTTLQDQLASQETAQEQAGEKAGEKAIQNLSPYFFLVMALSLLCEACIIGFIWFYYYYRYKVALEKKHRKIIQETEQKKRLAREKEEAQTQTQESPLQHIPQQQTHIAYPWPYQHPNMVQYPHQPNTPFQNYTKVGFEQGWERALLEQLQRQAYHQPQQNKEPRTASVPKERQAHPEDTASVPKERQAHPEDTASVPKERQAHPEDTASVPKERQAHPKAVQREDGWHIQCENCTESAVMTYPARFCKDSCRSAWHKKNKPEQKEAAYNVGQQIEIYP